MDELFAHDVWPRIEHRVGRNRVRLAAVAYIGAVPPLPFAKDSVLVIDASDRAIRNGSTRAAAVKALYDDGVRIYSLQGLHAKLFVVGRTALIGSANFSGNSAKLLEAVYASDNRWLVSETERVVGTFRDRALANAKNLGARTTDGLIADRRLEAILKIKPIERTSPHPHDANAFEGGVGSGRVWLSVSEPDDTGWTAAAKRTIKEKEAAALKALGAGFVSETSHIEPADVTWAKRYRPGDTTIDVHYYGTTKADVYGPCFVREGLYRADNQWALTYAYRRRRRIIASKFKPIFCHVTRRTDFPKHDILLPQKQGAELVRRFLELYR